MRQRKTPTSNHVFELPGGNEDNYLYVEVHLDQDNRPVITSVWELDDDERAIVAAGGTIELHVWGQGTPPVAISLGPSMTQRKEGARMSDTEFQPGDFMRDMRERDTTNRKAKTIKLNQAEIVAAHIVLDRLAGSLDWGSEFLTDDDIGAWNILAEAVGHRKVAVNAPHRGADGAIALPIRYSHQLLDAAKCESYLDTAVQGEAVRFHCGLRQKHRGDHLTYETGDLGPRFWNDERPV